MFRLGLLRLPIFLLTLNLYRLSSTLLLLTLLGTCVSAQQLVIPANPTNPIMDVAIDGAGKRMVTVANNSRMMVWDYPTGRLLRTIDLKMAELSFGSNLKHVAISRDGRYAAASNSVQFQVADLTEGALIFKQKYKTDSKYPRLGGVITHPTENAFYYTLGQADNEFLMRYDIGTRQVTKVAGWKQNDGSPPPLTRMSWSPTARFLLLGRNHHKAGYSVDVVEGKAYAYEGGETYLPNGNILRAERFTSSTKLSVADAKGNVIWTQSFRDPAFAGNKYSVNHVAVDAATQQFFFSGAGDKMVRGNYETGANVRVVTKPNGADNYVIAPAPNGRLLVTGTEPNIVTEISVATGQPLRTIGSDITNLNDLVGSDNGRWVGFSSYAGQVKLVQLSPRGLVTRARATLPGADELAISPNGRYLAALALKTKKVVILDGQSGTSRSLTTPFSPRAAALTNGGGLAVAGIEGRAYYGPATTGPTWQAAGSNAKYGRSSDYGAAISPDGQVTILMQPTEAGDEVTAYRVSDGRELWSTTVSSFKHFSFTPDGGRLTGVGLLTQIVSIDARTGKPLGIITRQDGQHNVTDFDPSGRYLVGTTNEMLASYFPVHLVDARSGKILKPMGEHDAIMKARSFLDGGRLLLTAAFDNTIRLWDTERGKELAKLFVYDNSDDWVVLAPSGRFDATPGAMQTLYYVVGDQVVPLEQLYENFYTPGLLGQLLEGSEPAPAPNVNINNLAPPPTVTIEVEEGLRGLVVEDDTDTYEARAQVQMITVKSRAEGSPIRELRLYHNGKLLGGTGRGLIVEDDDAEPGSFTKQKMYTINLTTGDNDLRAVAINDQGTESPSARLLIRYTAPAAAPTPDDGITLHLLTVGINEYQNRKYNLNYAAADAGGFEDALQRGLSSIVDRVKTYSLRDAEATRAGILDRFTTIREAAGPEDVFIFYYAGHGVMSDGQQRDFYLVPHDVTQLYGNPGMLSDRALSATELKNIAAAIPARKQLYLLDACQSAGAVESFALRGAAEEKAIAQLARSTGTHWLTASGSEQFASEFDELGHGAFTYAVLQALDGAAAGSDTRVTVNELKAYLDQVVPEMTEKYTGQAQYPASYGLGQDFPVSVVR